MRLDVADLEQEGAIREGVFSFRDAPGSRSIPMREIGLPEIVRMLHVTERRFVRQREDHVHRDFIEIELCVKGSLRLSNNRRIYKISPGSLVVNNPGVRHHIVDFPKNYEHYGISVAVPEKGSGFLGFTPCETELLFKRLMALPPVPKANSKRLLQVFREMFAAYDAFEGAERTLALRALVMTLLVEVAYLSSQRDDSAVTPSRRERILAIAGEMARSPENDFPLEDLAGRACLSAQSFSEQFRRVTGWSPHAYLVKCRIVAAKRLLLHGVSVTAVGDRLGFSSTSHFSAEFRRAIGLSPRDYVKKSCKK